MVDSFEECMEMLLKLLPIQIERYWPLVRQAVDGSLPPGTIAPEREHFLLQSILQDILQVWAIVGDSTGGKVKALLLTTVYTDDITQTKDLLVYATYSFIPVPDEIWKKVEEDLQEVARSSKCDRIVAYSDEPRVIELMTRFGYDSSYRLIVKEIDNG
jgi:hypothetical protein